MEQSARNVAIDANMLLAVFQFKVDIFSEIKFLLGNVKFFIPTQVLIELDSLENSLKSETRIGKQLLKKNHVKEFVIESKKADDALVKMAEKGFIIASNDKELRKRIKNLGGKSIYLRKKKFIEIEPGEL